MTRSERLDQEIKELEKYEAGLNGSPSDGEGTGESNAGDQAGQPGKQQDNLPPKPEENAGQEPAKSDLPKPQSQAGNENWELRFKNFKSSADTTISNLRQQVSELVASNAELEAKVDSLKSEVDRAKREAEGDELSSRLLSKKVTDIVGEDVAKELVEAIGSSFEKRVSPLEEKLKKQSEERIAAARKAAEDQKKKAADNFSATYREIIARNGFDFDDINHDQVFIHTYLEEYDPISGELRKDTLRKAIDRMDAGALAKLFVEYGRQKESSFTADIEPVGEGASAGLPPAANTPREDTISMKEIEDFYDGGGYKTMTAEEIEAFEARIERLTKEGKVTQ